MWKSHPLSAALTAARSMRAPMLWLAVCVVPVPALAQPVFSKAGSGTFSNVNTPLLLNDAEGRFQTQGSVFCQAPETGQLTSPAGVCMQYTPSVPFVGGAAAIFGLKGSTADYVSPPLTTSGDTPAGSSSVTVLNNAATRNVSTTSAIGAINTLSTLSAAVSGALPAGETIASAAIGTATTVLRLTRPTLADLPAGSSVSFTTNTSAQQFTGLASSVDLTAHQAPGSGGQAWAGNFIVEAEPGSSGLIHGIEIDVADFSANVGGYGVWLGNNGNQNMSAGFFVGGGINGKGWLYGLQSASAVNDDVLSISSATNMLDDHGSHAVGAMFEGGYGTAILQGINPHGLTPSTKSLFTITPQGGVVDSSPVPVAATSGSVQNGAQGSTGVILVCGGTLASITVALPPDPIVKQTYHIASECSVTALTVTMQTPAIALLGAPTSITPSTPVTFVYDNDRSTWLRW